MKKKPRLLLRILINNIHYLKIRLFKISNLLRFPELWIFVPKRIMPSFEHLEALRKVKRINALIDCGSNKGQFVILIYSIFKIKNYLSFDPIIFPEEAYKFLKNKKVNAVHEKVALSSKSFISDFFITEREDSSSLKRTINNSSTYCPDVFHKKTISVNVKMLDEYLQIIDLLPSPIALKVDVQGAEYDLLLGAKNVLEKVDYLFIEISYSSLYENTPPNIKIFNILKQYGFKEIISYNPLLRKKKLLSKDFLFEKIRN